MLGERVKIIEGDYKGKTGKIIDVYEGWTFSQYSVLLDDSEDIIVVYHDKVAEMEEE